MTKRQFVQRVIARLVPKDCDFERALSYAEALWDRLQAKGYGATESTGPREAVDWYAKLQGAARAQFDAFWEAYGHKKDRNGAAMRWYQLGDLAEAEARGIIDAAKADRKQWAESAQPGHVRKMAQGWLFERRWQDHAPLDTAPAAHREQCDRVLNGYKHQLVGLKRLYEIAPNDDIRRQIDEIVTKIGNFQRPSR